MTAAMGDRVQRTILVVGASRGIGAAVATHMLKQGHDVLIDWLLSLPPSVDVQELNLQQRSHNR